MITEPKIPPKTSFFTTPSIGRRAYLLVLTRSRAVSTRKELELERHDAHFFRRSVTTPPQRWRMLITHHNAPPSDRAPADRIAPQPIKSFQRKTTPQTTGGRSADQCNETCLGLGVLPRHRDSTQASWALATACQLNFALQLSMFRGDTSSSSTFTL